MQLSVVQAPTGYVRPQNEVHPEFPKWVHFTGKPSVLVDDAEAETALLAGAVPVTAKPDPILPPASVPNLLGENDERTMLLKIAADKGIRTDGRWNLTKLRKAVEAATSA